MSSTQPDLPSIRSWSPSLQLAGYIIAARPKHATHRFLLDAGRVGEHARCDSQATAPARIAYAHEPLSRSVRIHLEAHGVNVRELRATVPPGSPASPTSGDGGVAYVLAGDLDRPGVLPLPESELRSASLSSLPARLGLRREALLALMEHVIRTLPDPEAYAPWLDSHFWCGSFEAPAGILEDATPGLSGFAEPTGHGGGDRKAPACGGLSAWRICSAADAIRGQRTLRRDGEGWHLLESLAAQPVRRLPVPTSALVDAVRALREPFPHFASVIDRVVEELALRVLTGEPVRLPTLLMVGPPGIGKTHFAGALADAIEGHLLIRSLAEMTAGFEISGASRAWRDSRPGCVARHLGGMGDGLAPVFLFDELDKVRGASDHAVDATLLGLLEPVSVSRFRDEHLDIELDLRPASFLFAANRLDRLRPELKSRMEIVHVRHPTRGEMPGIVRSVDARLRRDRPALAQRIAPLPDAVVEALCESTPREVRSILQKAMARAAMRAAEGAPLIEIEPGDLRPPARPEPAAAGGDGRPDWSLLLAGSPRVH